MFLCEEDIWLFIDHIALGISFLVCFILAKKNTETTWTGEKKD
jgi:hypothetical protein